ncbi:hypothetical protein KXR53_32160 [Inquilinus limosus]|uniref:hypothetical protein n=1 Tax=Inquilinus limosus TaxID=171674 RepID=UPI003F13F6B0
MTAGLISDIRSRIAMPARPTRAGLIAGLLGSTAWLAMPDPVAAQACNMVMAGGVNTCTYSGSSSTWGFQTGSPDAPPMSVASTGNITMDVMTNQGNGLNFGSYGQTLSDFQTGGNVQGLLLTNSGSITLNAGSSTGDDVAGLQATQAAGDGGSGGGSSIGANGSVPAGVTINNSGTIDLNLSDISVGGGAAVWGSDAGGSGNGQNGGAGGPSSGVSITNSGAITADVSTYSGFAGILAQSAGGDGYNYVNKGDGGAAGPASVTLTQGSDVALQVSGTPPSSLGSTGGVVATVIGGQGGGGVWGGGGQEGGGGGTAGAATISITDATVSVVSGPTCPVSWPWRKGGTGALAQMSTAILEATPVGAVGAVGSLATSASFSSERL